MTPDRFPGARRLWLRLLGVARASARAAHDDHAAIALKQALRGQSEATFPLEAGDLRLAGVKAFLVLGRMWLAAGGGTRAGFAATLDALAGDLERLLIDQGAEVARAHLQRQGLG